MAWGGWRYGLRKRDLAEFHSDQGEADQGISGFAGASGLEGLKKAILYRLYANLNDESYEISGNSKVDQKLNYGEQRARSRKGIEWHPCKAIGED